MIDNINYCVFILVLVAIYIFAWFPYIGALIKKVYMTKGVLNMVPIDVILRNDKLRHAFITVGSNVD
jgi:hypothetical protein